MLFVSLDLETLGLGRSAPIIEFGAILADWLTGKMLVKFHTYVTPEDSDSYDNCEPYAMSMHPTILRRIATKEVGWDYTPIDQLTDAFEEWINNCETDFPSLSTHKLVLAGKNLGTFDLPMLEQQACGWPNFYRERVHHRCIDPGNLFWEPHLDNVLPNSDTCRERAHIERLEEEKHNALEDAEDVVKMVNVAVGRRVPASILMEYHNAETH